MMKPQFDRLIIEPLPDPETTASGLYIPGVSKERPGRGKVVAAGVQAVCKEGDIVLYNKNAAALVDMDSTLIHMRETAENIYVIL